MTKPCKHKLQSRYDYKSPVGCNQKVDGRVAPGESVKILREMKDEIYIGDICIRCGAWFSRPEEK